MRHVPLRRQTGAATVLALTLAAMAVSACGGGGGGPTDIPLPGDPSTPGDPSPTDPSPAPAPVGDVVYALDNLNYLIMFGTESGATPSRQVKITGLPILNRLIAIDFRESNGRLYGVGNDSRVYVIDTLTGAATAVSGQPFSPGIISFFDVHFGMDFDPATDRIRLVSNELGGNWSIDPDDGTAVAGKSPRYAAGDPNEGKTPHIGGLTYMPAELAPGQAVSPTIARLTTAGSCEEMLVAMDTELSQMIGSCDPDNGDFTSLGPINDVTALACVEIDYSGPGGGIWMSGQRINNFFNSFGEWNADSGKIVWKVDVPAKGLIQSISVLGKKLGLSRTSPALTPRRWIPSASLSSVGGTGALNEPEVDPVALCRGAGTP
jgi:hypothetical protein